jgi:hypothetical protein
MLVHPIRPFESSDGDYQMRGVLGMPVGDVQYYYILRNATASILISHGLGRTKPT